MVEFLLGGHVKWSLFMLMGFLSSRNVEIDVNTHNSLIVTDRAWKT